MPDGDITDPGDNRELPPSFEPSKPHYPARAYLIVNLAKGILSTTENPAEASSIKELHRFVKENKGNLTAEQRELIYEECLHTKAKERPLEKEVRSPVLKLITGLKHLMHDRKLEKREERIGDIMTWTEGKKHVTFRKKLEDVHIIENEGLSRETVWRDIRNAVEENANTLGFASGKSSRLGLIVAWELDKIVEEVEKGSPTEEINIAFKVRDRLKERVKERNQSQESLTKKEIDRSFESRGFDSLRRSPKAEIVHQFVSEDDQRNFEVSLTDFTPEELDKIDVIIDHLFDQEV